MKKKFTLILIVVGLFFIILASVDVFAEVNRDYNKKGWGKDPFVSYFDIKEKEEAIQRERERKRQEFNEGKKQSLDRKEIEKDLKKILFTGVLKGKENLAIMNNDIYAEGETIKESEIIEIGDGYVKLAKSGYEFELDLEEQSLQTKFKPEKKQGQEEEEGEEEEDSEKKNGNEEENKDDE